VSRAFLLSVLVLCLIGSTAFGQVIFTSNPQAVNTYFMPYLQNWKLDSQSESKSVSQISLPLFINLRPTDNLRLWIVDSFSSSSLDKSGEKNSLSGISDTKIKASYSMFDQKFLFTLGANLPIGKADVDPKELELANLLYDEVLGFRVNKLGEGFDLNAGVAMALDSGPFGESWSLSYLRKGSYTNVKGNTSDYKPGDEFGFMWTFDMITSKTTLNMDIGHTRYGSDEVNGVKSFKEGSEIRGKILVKYRVDPVILGLSLADIFRMKNQIEGANNKLTAEEKNSHGNRFDTTLTSQYLISRQLSVTPFTGLTTVADNGYGKGGAFIWNVGGSIQFAPNRDSSVSLNVKYLKGNMESGDVDVSGFEVGSVILVKF
jgi:hypothetical protein